MDLIRHHIAGQSVGSAERTGPVYDPATGAVQAEVAFASTAETDAAIAAAAAALGAVLIIVNVGVIVLFLAAVWVLARGAFGVFTLKAGQPIARPQAWLI